MTVAICLLYESRSKYQGTALAVPQEVFDDTRATKRMRGSARKRFLFSSQEPLNVNCPSPEGAK